MDKRVKRARGQILHYKERKLKNIFDLLQSTSLLQ